MKVVNTPKRQLKTPLQANADVQDHALPRTSSVCLVHFFSWRKGMPQSKHLLLYNLMQVVCQHKLPARALASQTCHVLLEEPLSHLSPDHQDQRVEWEQQQTRETHHLVVCMGVRCAGRNLCNPSDSGEYRINCISLLILSILQVTGLTYLKKCQALGRVRRFEPWPPFQSPIS